jgi:transposase InsO family protein
MESWFSTVKSEEGERFESHAHAKEALVDYIEVFYNERRRHSTLGQISPPSPHLHVLVISEASLPTCCWILAVSRVLKPILRSPRQG